MSRPIKITDEYRAAALREFAEALLRMRMTDGKISYTRELVNTSRRATVYFTPSAWMKMYMLITNFDKEVAWHGVAKRGDDPTKDEYIISDILVYPQKVTAATVETDQEEYENWLYSQPDEVFNNLRMQGHSHVNMGVSPSSVDTTHQEKIMRQLDDDMFYIFMIWNKSFTKWVKVYDFAKNTMFETSDLDVKIISEDCDLDAFLKDAKGLVKNTYTTYGNGGYSYGGYGNNGKQQGSQTTTKAAVPSTPTKTEQPAQNKKTEAIVPIAAKPADTKAEPEKKTGKSGAGDGWEGERDNVREVNAYCCNDDDLWDDDDEEGFYGGYLYGGRFASDPFYARGY